MPISTAVTIGIWRPMRSHGSRLLILALTLRNPRSNSGVRRRRRSLRKIRTDLAVLEKEMERKMAEAHRQASGGTKKKKKKKNPDDVSR